MAVVTSRFINLDTGTVETSPDRELYRFAFGHYPRTKADREAEWRKECERFADMIEAGNEWAVPPPCRRDARAIVAERAAEREARAA